MLCKIYCACCNGLEVNTVTIEVAVSDGIQFFLVGLPDSAVKESQQRICSALECYGYRIPGKKIVINMAPADLRKEGSAFDAAIAIGILTASGQITPVNLESFFILGELALDGSLRPIQGALPIIIQAKQEGFKGCILPTASALEGSEIEDITIYKANTLLEIIEILTAPEKCRSKIVQKPPQSTENEQYSIDYDFKNVRGQKFAKYALEIAAAGGHNIAMCGSPGSGKTFMAKCLPSILPKMTKEEAIETSKIYSVAGLLKGNGLLKIRPFRAPHHTITVPALVGGGNKGLPGEVSLAHNGVLFADEFAEFQRRVIEVLRQPLEDGYIQISRVRGKYYYPARFMLVAAMNPCPCGLLYDSPGKCRCSSAAIEKYLAKISGPVFDRIDINIKIKKVKASDLLSNTAEEESSRDIAQRVFKARQIQNQRYLQAGENFYTNASIPPSKLPVYCSLGASEIKFMSQIMSNLGITARGYSRILKIARTIADLSGSPKITVAHLSTAIKLRSSENDYLCSSSV